MNNMNSIAKQFDQLFLVPRVSLSPIERRQARLTIALALIATLGIGIRAFLFTVEAIYVGAFFLILFAYLLSRIGKHLWASIVLVCVLTVPIYSSLFTLEIKASGEVLQRITWLSFSFILSSILFSIRGVAFYTLICAIFLFLMPVFKPDIPMSALVPSIGYVVINAALLLVAAIFRNQLERIRQRELQAANEALRQSEASLERRVEERTKEAEQARKTAEQANQVKSQFLAAMSHELRTPLNAIINLSEFIQDEMLGPVNDGQRDAAGNVVESGRHLLALINDVLDISKIEAGSLQLFIEDNLDMRQELLNLELTARTLLGASDVKVVLDVQDPLPSIRGDRLRVRQVLLNLVSNACKFTEHGSITISARSHNGTLNMVIRDTGPGIKPEDLTTIFETFRQTEVGLRKGKGTGLGLPIARRLVEAHGGSLTVESLPGHGASFMVCLPVHADHLVPMLISN